MILIFALVFSVVFAQNSTAGNQTIPRNSTIVNNTIITNTTIANNTIPNNSTTNRTVVIPPVLNLNGNCFACVSRGNKYCDRDNICYPQNTTQNCTSGKFLDLESGCPIRNYCNLTTIPTRGVLMLEDLKQP
jgi:hypothetical protein